MDDITPTEAETIKRLRRDLEVMLAALPPPEQQVSERERSLALRWEQPLGLDDNGRPFADPSRAP